MPKADFWVVIAILSALAGYCAKIYFSWVSWLICFFYYAHSISNFYYKDNGKWWNFLCRFQQNMATYQNLITQSMYDKQLDSGKGTLLHLCDDVIQQEVGLDLHNVFSWESTPQKETNVGSDIWIRSLANNSLHPCGFKCSGQGGHNSLLYFDGKWKGYQWCIYIVLPF